MEKKEPNQMEKNNLSLLTQWIIFACLCVIAILISMSILGKAEYNQNYCASRLELQSNEKPALMLDRVSNTYGCCRVPDGAKQVSRKEYCVDAPDYKIPSLPERIRQILKRFK